MRTTGPLGCQLIKVFVSRPARRSFTTSPARCMPTSATRFSQAGVSASMAIWSSVSRSNSASEYGVVRSLRRSSQSGSELFERLSSMSWPVPLPEGRVTCWLRPVALSNSQYGHGLFEAAIKLSTIGRCDLIPTVGRLALRAKERHCLVAGERVAVRRLLTRTAKVGATRTGQRLPRISLRPMAHACARRFSQ